MSRVLLAVWVLRLKNNLLPYLTKLVKKLGPRIGARVIVEPKWGRVAQIVYKNGVVRSLSRYSLDLNNIASADVAKDKDFSKFFIKKWGYPVAEGQAIFRKDWAKTVGEKHSESFAKSYARKLGYPVIIKPNSQSQGAEVNLVFNAKELSQALARIFKIEQVALVEKYLPGKDYRVVVLDSKIISAYQRIPLHVVGDGRQSVLSLLEIKQKKFNKDGRDTRIDFSNPTMRRKIERGGYTLRAVLPKGKKVFLLDNANLSTGGDALDVTRRIHPSFQKIAIEVTRKMGLRMAGVDIMLTVGDITQDSKETIYYIIEINAAPGLDHYVTTGEKQRKIVEAMYLKILKALGKRD